MNALETDSHVGSHLAIAVVRIGHVGHQFTAVQASFAPSESDRDVTTDRAIVVHCVRRS